MNQQLKQYEEVEAPGTEVVGAVHYCIYLEYFACEMRPSGSPQPFVYLFLAAEYKMRIRETYNNNFY